MLLKMFVLIKPAIVQAKSLTGITEQGFWQIPYHPSSDPEFEISGLTF